MHPSTEQRGAGGQHLASTLSATTNALSDHSYVSSSCVGLVSSSSRLDCRISKVSFALLNG